MSFRRHRVLDVGGFVSSMTQKPTQIPLSPAQLQRKKRRKTFIGIALIAIFLVGFSLKQRYVGSVPIAPGLAKDAVAPLANWPWQNAKETKLRRGVTLWSARQHDGTLVEMLCFDFAKNPDLRFEFLDQDADDAVPWNNEVRYSALGVGGATRKLNQKFGGNSVVAAWNGVFFGYLDGAANPFGRAFHVSPVVINGQVHHWGSNHRWTFGAKTENGKTVFKTFFRPDKSTLKREFDFAGGSVQCLLRDGKPLRLQPFPQSGDAPLPQPVVSTKAEAGHIPVFDHMRTCRASMAWTKDSAQLFVLLIKEPDNESLSAWALQYNWPIGGGWTVADVQRFWLSLQKPFGITDAINSDAGNVLQYTFLRPDQKYDLVTARGAGVTYERATFDKNFHNAPGGGSLTYFYVREIGLTLRAVD